MQLYQLASLIRSKNAGPFVLTFDILFSDDATYRRVRDSGALNAEEFARRYGISRSLLLNWRRSFCTEPDGAAEQKTGFVPAMVVADPAPSVPAVPASGRMVIEIGRDRRVIVDAGVDGAALARVLAILERR